MTYDGSDAPKPTDGDGMHDVVRNLYYGSYTEYRRGMTETTTIQVTTETWKRLNARKEPSDDFEDVVVSLLEDTEESQDDADMEVSA